LRRIAAPEDIANAIAFIVSDESRHINGIALRIEGGEAVNGWV
jgi:NAD(P)-dependent dehydrogenase (short-subunit alcohol dehydrogenase family)